MPPPVKRTWPVTMPSPEALADLSSEERLKIIKRGEALLEKHWAIWVFAGVVMLVAVLSGVLLHGPVAGWLQSLGLGRIASHVIGAMSVSAGAAFLAMIIGSRLLRNLHDRAYREAMRELGCDVCLKCGYWLRGLDDTVSQCPECGASRAAVSGETMQPEAFIAAYEAALATQDWSAVEPLVHQRACVTFSSGEVHEGKEAVRAAFTRNFSLIKSEAYAISNVRWVMKSHDVAVYLFEFSWRGVIDGKSASGAGHGTCVITREVERWQLLVEHLGRSHQ